ncbi:DUF397 domain-containing protein [Streptomyces sp. URMC 126]|uniref:DUF397 domain-containing protein n=1 Tax=Streptomyces sp. URMC 126 TaxID=3423401 RepID=UPI003F1D92F2
MIWRKSTHSATSNDCLEVTDDEPDAIHIRDSKHPDEPSLILTTAPAAWSAFLAALRAGGLGS